MGRVGAGVGISGRPPRRSVPYQSALCRSGLKRPAPWLGRISASERVSRRVSPSRCPCCLALVGLTLGDTQHLACHVLIERNPRLPQLGCKCSTELGFQTPDQCVTECNEMRCPCPKLGVLTAGMADDRLKQIALIECADNGGDAVHQLEVLSFHVAGKQTLRVRSELEETRIESFGELSPDRPHRVE